MSSSITGTLKQATTNGKLDSYELPPNMPVLEGTPPKSSWPLSESQMISIAKDMLANKNGIEKPELLADDFRFEFPIIKIGKKDYLKALSTFKFEQTFPDISQATYGFYQDPYEPQRVWFMTRAQGTHKRVLNLGSVRFQPTNKMFRAPPQIMSFTFNTEGKVTSFTGGYVADNRVGNTGGLGGLFGILVGVGLPYPGSARFFAYTLFIKLADVVNFFTLGVSNKLFKRE